MMKSDCCFENGSASAAATPSWTRSAALRLAIVANIAASAVLMTGCKPRESTPPPANTTAVAKPSTSPAVPEAVRALLGRWMRLDGGYVLELRQAELSGQLEAAYFNPNPIRVSRAIWMQGPTGFQVVVELNDVGYPGATYVLSHDARTDRFVGKYTQPAMQQSFDIEFLRQPR